MSEVNIGQLLSEVLSLYNSKIKENIPKSIYVGNLSFEATEADVTNVFKEYGEVKKVYLPSDRETGKMRGFGFVEMETENQESAAIDKLNGSEWMGRILKVNKAKPRE